MKKLFLLFLLFPALASAQTPPDIVLDFHYGYHIEGGTQLNITHLIMRSNRIPIKKNVIYNGVEIFSFREDRGTEVSLYRNNMPIESKPLFRGYAELEDSTGEGADTIYFSGRANLNRVIVHLRFSGDAEPESTANPPAPPAPLPPPAWADEYPVPPDPSATWEDNITDSQTTENHLKEQDVVIKDYIKANDGEEITPYNLAPYTQNRGFSNMTILVDTSHFPVSVNHLLLIDSSGQQQHIHVSRQMTQGVNKLGIALPRGTREIRLGLIADKGAHITVTLQR